MWWFDCIRYLLRQRARLAQFPLVRGIRITGTLRWIASEISSWNAYAKKVGSGVDINVD